MVVRFDQVKLIAHDVSGLADFYSTALGCVTLEALQTWIGGDVARGMGAPDAEITVVMLGLPGHEESELVLEIYSVTPAPADWAYGPGQCQTAFQVDDLDSSVDRFLDRGGSMLGEIVEWRAQTGNLARFVYLRDPEGNLVDLWQRVRHSHPAGLGDPLDESSPFP